MSVGRWFASFSSACESSSIVSEASDSRKPNREGEVPKEPRSTEEVFVDFLDQASKAPSIIEVNVAAGLAMNELRGVDVEP
jgi:hypothetical protein